MNPDWYPDPSNPSQQRFWDGIEWTEHIYGPHGRGTDRGLPGYPPPLAPGSPDSWPVPPDPQWAGGPPSGAWPAPGTMPFTSASQPQWPAPGTMPLAPPGPPPAYGPPVGYGQQPGYTSPGGYTPPGGYSPPGGYGFGGHGPNATGGFPAPAPWSGGSGPLGRPTSPGIQILLTIVTLGIWALVWIYRQYRDMKRYSGSGLGGGVGLLINFIPSVGILVSLFLMADEVEQLYVREGRRAPVSAIYGLLGFIPLVGYLIWYLLVQRAINDFWVGHGAPRP